MTIQRVLIKTNSSFEEAGDVYVVQTTTDIACHQRMAWSLIKYTKMSMPLYKRNVFIGFEFAYFLPAPTYLDQDEPGDTLIHTFKFADWPPEQTRFYYFSSTIDGTDVNTASPCITLKRPL